MQFIVTDPVVLFLTLIIFFLALLGLGQAYRIDKLWAKFPIVSKVVFVKSLLPKIIFASSQTVITRRL